MQPKKIILCVVIALIQHSYSSAQDVLFSGIREQASENVKIGVTGGLGRYLQPDLSEINSTILNGFTSGELTENFPCGFFWGVYFLRRIRENLFIGPDYQYHSSGSRLYHSESSGSYTLNQLIWSHAVALQAEGMLREGNRYQVCLGARFGVNICSWKLREDISVSGSEEGSSTRSDAFRPFFFPSLKLRYRLFNQFSITPAIGYNLDIGGNYRIHGESQTILKDEAFWKGPRAELSFDWSF